MVMVMVMMTTMVAKVMLSVPVDGNDDRAWCSCLRKPPQHFYLPSVGPLPRCCTWGVSPYFHIFVWELYFSKVFFISPLIVLGPFQPRCCSWAFYTGFTIFFGNLFFEVCFSKVYFVSLSECWDLLNPGAALGRFPLVSQCFWKLIFKVYFSKRVFISECWDF